MGAIYLHRAGALERTRRGVFRITERGRELLQKNFSKINVQTLSQFPEFVAFHKGTGDTTAVADGQQPKLIKADTPEEQLAAAYKVLRESLANEVLETVKKLSPAFFEELVIDLLVAMGYGGSMEDAGRAVGRSGDGGIDGIIKEDKTRVGLGLRSGEAVEQPCRASGCSGVRWKPGRIPGEEGRCDHNVLLLAGCARLRAAHRETHCSDRWQTACRPDDRIRHRRERCQDV